MTRGETKTPNYDPRLTTLHADMDAFFAAVEVLDDPTLAGKPLIIGHPGKRGVVSTASYEARKFGVHSALPSVVALRRCPQGVWRSPRMARYAEISRQVRDIFRQFTPVIEPLSLDEAFLDVEGSLRLFGGAIPIAEQLRHAMREETGGLTVSVGVAENKFLAKLGSDFRKPDGITVVPAGKAPEFLAPLAVGKLWGVGPRTANRLQSLGIRKCEDIVRVGEKFLRNELGQQSGSHIWRLAQGIDERSVESGHAAKSISTESTFAEDLVAEDAIHRFLFEAADNVAGTLRSSGLKARTVQLKVRTGSFRTFTRARTLDAPTDLRDVLYHTALDLLREKIDLQGEGVRLLGVGGKGLVERAELVQGSLFDDSEVNQKQQRIVELSDRIRDAHGARAITWGRMVHGKRTPEIERPGEDDPLRVRRTDLLDEE